MGAFVDVPFNAQSAQQAAGRVIHIEQKSTCTHSLLSTDSSKTILERFPHYGQDVQLHLSLSSRLSCVVQNDNDGHKFVNDVRILDQHNINIRKAAEFE